MRKIDLCILNKPTFMHGMYECVINCIKKENYINFRTEHAAANVMDIEHLIKI